MRPLNWVRTRQRQMDLLKKCGAESSRVHGHAPLHFQYVPHSTATVTAFRFRFRRCLGSMRASMQGLGCVRYIYQIAYFISKYRILTYVNLKNAKCEKLHWGC